MTSARFATLTIAAAFLVGSTCTGVNPQTSSSYGGINVTFRPPIAQEYVPAVSTHLGMRVCLRNSTPPVSGGADQVQPVSLLLHEGSIDGPVVAQQTRYLIPNQYFDQGLGNAVPCVSALPEEDKWVAFFFEYPVELIIGETYVIEVTSPYGGYLWNRVRSEPAGGDAYQYGLSLVDGVPLENGSIAIDMNFQALVHF